MTATPAGRGNVGPATPGTQKDRGHGGGVRDRTGEGGRDREPVAGAEAGDGVVAGAEGRVPRAARALAPPVRHVAAAVRVNDPSP